MPTHSKRQIRSSPIVEPGSKKKSKLHRQVKEEDDDRQYMMLRHHSPRQEEEQQAEVNDGEGDTSEKAHYIAKSPDGRMITRFRGRGRGANAAPSTASRQVSQQETAAAVQPPQDEDEDDEVAIDDATISQAASVLRGVSEDANSLTKGPPTPGGQTLHNLPSWRYVPSRSGEDLSIGLAPSWGSIDIRQGTFDYGDYNSTEPMELSVAAALAGYSPGTSLLNDQYVCGGPSGSSVITPATTIRKGMKASGGSPKIAEDGNDGEELIGEWLPPREGKGGASSSERKEKVVAATVHVPPPPAREADKSKNAPQAYHHPEEVDPRYVSHGIQPQFIRRQPSYTRSSNTHHHFYQPPQHQAAYSPPRYHPSVVGASRSHSNDSSESPGNSLLNAGGRVQVVGGAHHEWDASPWSVVSRSRSAESSGSATGGGSGLYSNEWEPPKPNRTPMAPTPGRPGVAAEYRGGNMGPPPPPSSYHPEYESSYSPDKASSSSPWYPPGYPGPPSGSGYRQYPPPSSAYPPHHHPYSSYPPHQYYGGRPEDGNPDNAEPHHPLIKNYNPHKDGIIRPQFQNVKRTKAAKRAAAAAAKRAEAVLQYGSSGGVVGVDYVTPRRRRCRDPNEKAAAAAAMAAAAAVKFKKDAQSLVTSAIKEEEQQDDKPGEDEPSLKEPSLKGPEAVSSLPFTEEELKTLGSGDDEDIPAAKRAAMASVLALREAAGGSPVPPPKSASEVTFDITNPPDEPVIPPSTVPVIDSLTQMTENDVLCGRGGGTNSTMGNRHYRALVRDFQPTYLMALRRDKPLLARSVVLVIRNRGGRFLRRDEKDGRLYEVGDEKAEAKTSQALREGLDVRATKSAANTLRGTTGRSDGTKKRKNSSSSDEGSLKSKDGKKKLAEPVIKVPKHLPQPLVHSGQHVQPPPPGYHAPPHHPYYYGGPPPYHPAMYHGYHPGAFSPQRTPGAPQFMHHRPVLGRASGPAPDAQPNV